MPDPKIIDYLRQNQGKYPLEALKQALIKNGFNAADVDEAVRLLEGGSAPPPPQPEAFGAASGAAQPGAGGRIRLSPGGLFSNALHMVKDPEGFFSLLDPEAGLGGGVLNVLLWALIAAVLSLALALAGIGASFPGAKIMAVSGLVLVPIMAVVLSFVGSLIFHVLCKIMGGTAAYSGSYNAMAAMIALAPASAVLSLIPVVGALPIQLYGLYLSVQAAWGVHAVPKKRSWIVFGILTFIGIGSSLVLNMAARKLQSAAGGLPGMFAGGVTQQGSGMDPAQALSQAQEQVDQAMSQLDPQAQQQMQAVMEQTQQQAGQIMQDMNRFGAMDAPPAQTLALLDQKGQARLSEVWPGLSAPVRQSLVQSLPQVPANQRLQSIEQVVQATAGVNEMVNQSMQLLQQMQNPQPQEKKRRR